MKGIPSPNEIGASENGSKHGNKVYFLIGLIFFLFLFLSITTKSDEWDIKVPIENSTYLNYKYQSSELDYRAFFRENINTGESVRFEKDGYFFVYDISGGDMLWAVQDGKPAAIDTLGGGCPSNSQDSLAQVVDNKVEYPSAFCNTNVTYQVYEDMLKETFILGGLPSIKEYTYLQYSGNIKFNRSLQICTDEQCFTPSGTKDDFETSGKIYFKDMQNNTIFYLREPFITDAIGRSVLGVYKVHGSDAQMNFWLRIPTSFIKNATFPIYIDPTVTWSSYLDYSNWVTPLSSHTFVVASCADSPNLNVSFKVYDTNGTALTGEVVVDSTAGRCDKWSVGLSALNETQFVISWWDYGGGGDLDISFAIYNSDGTQVVSQTDVDTDVAYGYMSSVAAFNSTLFVISFWDDTDDDVTFAIYNSTGGKTAGPTDVDTSAGTSYSAFVTVLNSTHFITPWYDAGDQDASFQIWNSQGTNTTDPKDVDTAVSTLGYPVVASAFNSTLFVVCWYDYADQDVTFQIWNSQGVNLTDPKDVDTAVGTGRAVQCEALNSTYFIISWYDQVDFDLTYAAYTSAGTQVIAPTDIESYASAAGQLAYHSLASQKQGTNIGFCSDTWVIAYGNASYSNSVWRSYYANGTAWNGICPAEGPPPDTTSPQYSLNSTNTTLAGVSTLFSLNWTDTVGLSGYVFSFDNGTGVLTNGTWTAMTGTSNWSNVTKVVNSTTGATIRWCVYANDTSNNWNTTSCTTPFSYLTTAGNAAPAITANATTPTKIYNNSDLLFNITATDSDNASINAYVQFYINDSPILYVDKIIPDEVYCSGTWSTSNPCSMTYDGNFSSYGANSTSNASVYLNYSKPTGIQSSGSVWRIWYSGAGYSSNQTITSGCWNYLSDKLVFKAEIYDEGGSVSIGTFCYNGTGWHGMNLYILGSTLYENQMYFKIATNMTISNNTNTNIANLSYYAFDDADNLSIEFWAGDGTTNTTHYYRNLTVYSYSANSPSETLNITLSHEEISNKLRNQYDSVSVTSMAGKRLSSFKNPFQDNVITAGISRVVNLFKSFIKSISLTESIFRSGQHPKAVSQEITFGEITNKSSLFLRKTSDSVTITELKDILGNYTRTNTQSITLSELLVSIGMIDRESSMALGFIDSAYELGLIDRKSSDSFTMSSLSNIIAMMDRDGITSITITELLSRLGVSTKSASQVVTINELVKKVGMFDRDIGGIISLNELNDVVGYYSRNQYQSTTILELLTRFGLFGKDTSTSISLYEELYSARVFNHRLSDTISVSELNDVIELYSRRGIQNINIDDLLVSLGIMNRQVTSSGLLTELLARYGISTRSASTAITLAEVISRSGLLNLNLEDTITITELQSFANGYVRTGTDSITFAELLTRLGIFDISSSQQISLYDSLFKFGIFGKQLSDMITIGELNDLLYGYSRMGQLQVSYAELLYRLGIVTRDVNTPFSIPDFVVKGGYFDRKMASAIGVNELQSDLLSIKRSGQDTISLYELLDMTGYFSRTADDSTTAMEYIYILTYANKGIGDGISISELLDILNTQQRYGHTTINLYELLYKSHIVTKQMTLSMQVSEAVSRFSMSFRSVHDYFVFDSLSSRIGTFIRNLFQGTTITETPDTQTIQYMLDIIQPNTTSPVQVNCSNVIEVAFNFTKAGIPITKNVTVLNVTVGGIACTIGGG